MDTNLTDVRIRECTVAGLWRNESLETYLDRWATARPDKTALVDGQGRYTWAALALAVERVAHGLRAHGLEPGGVISCQLPNWNEFALVFLAASRLGAVVNPIPPTYRASELRFMLGLLESQALIIPAVFRGFDHREMASQLKAGEDKDATLPTFKRLGSIRRDAEEDGRKANMQAPALEKVVSAQALMDQLAPYYEDAPAAAAPSRSPTP